MLNRRIFIHQLTGGAAALAGSSMFPPARVLGANDRVRFGLIGAGGRGTAIFKAALKAPNTQAVAVADVYSRRLDAIKHLVPSIQTYTDFRRLLDDKSVDAVLIATPQHQHALNFVPAIRAGKDVYQEKTMAFNPDHARRMRRAVEGSNRVVQVGIQSVSGKAFERARELATPDRLGNITAMADGNGTFPLTAIWKTSLGKSSKAKRRRTTSIRSASSIGGFSGIIPAETFLRIWSTR